MCLLICMVDQTNTAVLGKPVSEWKTSLARGYGGLCFLGGALLVGFGVGKIVNGCRVANPDYFSLCTKIVGTGMTAVGLTSTALGAAVWDSATSAQKTRKYVELAEKLNEKPGRAAQL